MRVILLLLLACFSSVHPRVSWGEAPAVAASTNRLGLELLRRTMSSAARSNRVLSPLSIVATLSMTARGAVGDTRREMESVLGFVDSEEDFSRGLRGIVRELDRVAEGSEVGDSLMFGWSLANRIFIERSFPLKPQFLASLRSEFGADAESLDFRGGAESARVHMNGWVSERTHHRIREILPPGAVDALSRLVLVNALYLRSPWAEPFKESATTAGSFFPRGEASIRTQFMHRTAALPYTATPLFEAVGVPYRYAGLQATFLVPRPSSSVEEIVNRLSSGQLAELVGGKSVAVALSLPKFKLEGAPLRLKEIFQELGMRRAFDIPSGSADFSRISGQPELFIGDIFHQGAISVDERGTEATAATAVTMMVRGLPIKQPEPVLVVVDRPFLFAVHHAPSGACLFLGVVENPLG